MVQAVLTPANLGAEFAVGTEVANKVTVRPSTDAGNLIRIGSDSRAVLMQADLAAAIKNLQTVTNLVIDNTAKTLTYTNEAGSAEVIDLSQFAVDISVATSGSAFDPATQLLTLKQTEGGPDVVIDLSKIRGVTTANSATVTLTGSGNASATALTAKVNLSATAGNAISANADGLFVAPGATKMLDTQFTDAFGIPIGWGNSTAAL